MQLVVKLGNYNFIHKGLFIKKKLIFLLNYKINMTVEFLKLLYFSYFSNQVFIPSLIICLVT